MTLCEMAAAALVDAPGGLTRRPRTPHRPSWDGRLRGILDRAAAHFDFPPRIFDAFDRFVDDLAVLRAESSDDWTGLVGSLRQHGLFARHLISPFAERAYRKPRGYADDPRVVDHLLGEADPLGASNPSPMGRMIGDAWRASSLGLAYRYRRAMFAQELVDLGLGDRPNPRVLCLGAGHLREARGPRAPAALGIAELVALDQDRQALEALEAEAIPGVHLDDRPWLSVAAEGLDDLGPFDFAYLGGVLERMDDGLAREVVARVGAAVRPGGRLLLSSLQPGLRTLAAMDALLDWRPSVRDQDDLLDVSGQPGKRGATRVHLSPGAEVAFLAIDFER
jgi:hypothetical protein